MKGVLELKPALPRYSDIWDVNIVLDYLKTFNDLTSISLKALALKLTMLLCLTTGQRGQTVHKIDVNCIQELPDRYRITVEEKLKQTKPGRHLKPIELRAFHEDESICVFRHLKEYLLHTSQHRTLYSKLLLSYIKPFKPVSRNTVSRWVKEVLRSSGIDTEKYSAHSSRAASTSFCKAKGLSMLRRLLGFMRSHLIQIKILERLFWDVERVTCGCNFIVNLMLNLKHYRNKKYIVVLHWLVRSTGL